MTSPDTGRLGLFFGILLLAGIGVHVVASAVGVNPIAIAPAYMFSPMVAGLVVCFRENIALSTVGLRGGRGRWLVVAAVVALPLIGVALLLAITMPGVGFDPAADPVPGLPLPSGPLGVLATFGLALGLGVTVNAVFAFGEEFGWRGYLLWELAPMGFWRASVAIGAAWGLWHAPIIVAGYNYPSFPVLGVVAMTAACVSYSPVYTYLVVRAESVFAAALLHGVFNGSAGLVIAYAVADGAVLREFVASPVGAAGVLAFGLAAVGIAVTGPPELTREFAEASGESQSSGQ